MHLLSQKKLTTIAHFPYPSTFLPLICYFVLPYQGISVPAPPMATIAPSMDSSQSPNVLPMTGESAMQQLQNLAEPVEGDTFRNAARKAPHLDAIVPKLE